ncbi:hypothetical protein FRC12_021537 [Ceratobasidium sp. 428]|nr:hypothetical protein FRC12_021537 [Ceratobasidium sp. 428]
MDPVKPYRLTDAGEDPNRINNWVERFHAWAQRVGANVEWFEESHDGGWRVKLRLNGHYVPNHIGQGDKIKRARADLVRKLEHATPPVMTLPLLSNYRVSTA